MFSTSISEDQAINRAYSTNPHYMQPDHDHQPSDRKYAKKLIKLAKKHPEYYSKEEVRFAKRMKKLLKKPKTD